MRRHTVLLPLLLPRLSDPTAARLVELLRAILAGIEHHYAGQVQRYRKRQQQIQHDRIYPRSPPPTTHDPPF